MRAMMSNNLKTRGLSLIEIMVALAIGSFLLLGIMQIFSGSSAAFRTNEANSRIQESSRFAMDFLRRDLRMVGHLGCVNDRTHFAPGVVPTLFSTFFDAAAGQTFTNAPLPLRFDLSIQGYEARNTQPGQLVNIAANPAVGAAADWVPALPAPILALNPLAGSDVVVLRYFSAEAVRSYGPARTTFTTPDPVTGQFTFNVSFAPFPVEARRFYGAADCQRARVFQLSTAAGLPGVVSVLGANGANVVGFGAMESLDGFREFFAAESVVFYTGRGVSGEPALFRARLANSGGWVGEEIVEGVENLQVLYGFDPQLRDLTRDYVTANTVDALPGADAAKWLQVSSVKVGILVRNPGVSNTQRAAQPFRLMGLSLQAPLAAQEPIPRLRRAYETTVSLRNRLRTI
ncbi:MAG: PilW family protein [Xanthomonadales bacterium]|nr:PilW family protein [Xanthomonadales bacterium]